MRERLLPYHKNETGVQQVRVQDQGRVSKSHMKSIALENPTVLPSAAQMYALMIGANMLITVFYISSNNETFFFLF